MALRKAHGARANDSPLRIEVLPPDELPKPLPVDLAVLPAPVVRREDGTISDSATAKALGARGGAARHAKRKMLQGLGLAVLTEADEFHPYWRAVEDFVSTHLGVLAAMCGGAIGPGPSSIVGTAGVQLAASRYYSDQAAKNPSKNVQYFTTASRLGEASRQSLLAAYELGRREGEARKQAIVDPFAAIISAGEIEARTAVTSEDATDAIDD